MRSAERRSWAQDVIAALGQNCVLDVDEFIFLTGVPYRKNLVSHIKHYRVPMEGLDFGTQLQWLGRQAS